MLRTRLGEKGLTLIELLIVVAILVILAAIAIPRFGYMRYKSAKGYYLKHGQWPKGTAEKWMKYEASDDFKKMRDRESGSSGSADKSKVQVLDFSDVTYYYDPRTELCYAKFWSRETITVVPCEKVKAYLGTPLNPQ